MLKATHGNGQKYPEKDLGSELIGTGGRGGGPIEEKEKEGNEARGEHCVVADEAERK